MRQFDIPTALERAAARKITAQVIDYDEEVAAVEEFVSAHRPAPSQTPADPNYDEDDA